MPYIDTDPLVWYDALAEPDNSSTYITAGSHSLIKMNGTCPAPAMQTYLTGHIKNSHIAVDTGNSHSYIDQQATRSGLSGPCDSSAMQSQVNETIRDSHTAEDIEDNHRFLVESRPRTAPTTRTLVNEILATATSPQGLRSTTATSTRVPRMHTLVNGPDLNFGKSSPPDEPVSWYDAVANLANDHLTWFDALAEPESNCNFPVDSALNVRDCLSKYGNVKLGLPDVTVQDRWFDASDLVTGVSGVWYDAPDCVIDERSPATHETSGSINSDFSSRVPSCNLSDPSTRSSDTAAG